MAPTLKGFRLIACAGLLTLATCFRLWSQRRLLGRVICALARAVVPCWRGAAPMDPSELRVRKEYERQRVQRARGGIALISAWGAGHFLVFWAQHRSGDEVHVPVSTYVLAAISILATLRPAAITSRTLDIGYSVAIGCLVASTLFEDASGLSMGGRRVGLFVYVFILSVLALKSWLVVLGFLALGGSIAVRLALLGEASAPDVLRSTALGLMFLPSCDLVLMNSVRAETRAKDSGKQLLAVQTLLDSICDVVVELGAGLRLTQHSAKLADILLQGPLRSLAGVALQEFMPDESDRERFEQVLGGNEAGARSACVFHTNLRDSMSSTVAMELFSVALDSPDGHRRHILGMRECTDVQPLGILGPAVQRRRLPPAPAAGPSQELRRGTPQSLERQDLAEHGSSPSSSRASEGDADSEGSRSEVGSRGARPSLPPLRLTMPTARRVTLLQLLRSWKVEETCCEWHAGLAEAQSIVASVAPLPCAEPQSRKERGWQCQRCGIVGKEHRLSKRAKDCSVCETFSDDMLLPVARRGISSL